MRLFLGFIFHKIAFGLLSVFLPLYITEVINGGSLSTWGMIAAAATFIAIPFSLLWGYLCDATRRLPLLYFVVVRGCNVAALPVFTNNKPDATGNNIRVHCRFSGRI
jgi:MFS family permease